MTFSPFDSVREVNTRSPLNWIDKLPNGLGSDPSWQWVARCA